MSKGLGAPVGSAVVGSQEFVGEARRMRQMLGGGVRQGGVLAAAGLIALDRVADLAQDHRNATSLASGLAEFGWEVNQPQTNIVLAMVPDPGATLSRLAELGVRASSIGGRVRFVTHRDVSEADVRDVLDRIGRTALRNTA
jgi:threonine aldolase